MKNRLYSSEEELLEQATKLKGKSLYELYGKSSKKQYKGKGGLGNKVEEIHYGIENNNNKEPDVYNLGVEIKTNPLKQNISGVISPKERVVLGMINFTDLVNESFEDSSFLKKNNKVLYNMYLYTKEQFDYEYKFVLIDILEIDKSDIKIIKNDWLTIQSKAKSLNADEISQSDTNYLIAVTKGQKSQIPQPYYSNSVKGFAKRRAFAFKEAYVRHLINQNYRIVEKNNSTFLERIDTKANVKQFTITDENNVDIRKTVLKKFESFLHKRDIEIASVFGEENKFIENKDKARWHWNTSLILTGKKKKYLSNYIEEFSKSGLTVKTIRTDDEYNPLEEISFRTQDYLVRQDSVWEESSLYEEMSKTFLWVVYVKNKLGDFVLNKVFFWTMPESDLDFIQSKWQKYVGFVLIKDFRPSYFMDDESFYYMKIKDQKGGANKIYKENDVTSLSHWLRKKYVKEIIESIT